MEKFDFQTQEALVFLESQKLESHKTAALAAGLEENNRLQQTGRLRIKLTQSTQKKRAGRTEANRS